MAIFNNMSLTNKGQILYAKAQAGIKLKFTKMMVGSGDIDSRNPATLLALINPQFDIGIQSITPNTELKTATISGTINNEKVTEAIYICEIGLFAEDPDEGEILYAYGTAGKYGDYYAPASQGAYSWNYQINAAIGNAANVTVELSNLGYDYSLINSNTTFIVISGGNQKEINKSIDKKLSELAEQSKEIANKVDNIKIADATIAQKGIVQLNNTTNSTSITQAATANAVKLAMDRANEAFTGADNYKKGIAGVIGSPVLDTQNKDEAVNSIQGIKNNAASALKSKNVDASGNEALASLVGKINNINIEGMGGIRCKFETIYYTSGKLTINTDFDIAVAIISLIDSVSRQTCFIAGEPNYITCANSGWYSSYSSSTGGGCNSNCFGLVNSRAIYFSPNNNRYENRNIKVFIIGKVGN